VLIVLGMLLGFGSTPKMAHAAELEPLPNLPCWSNSLPSNDSLYPADQQILFCVPLIPTVPPTPDWNRDLVIYAHGYVDPNAPLGLPDLNLYQDKIFTPNPASLPAALLSQRYAFATTSYHKNGYAIEQGAQDINALVLYVKNALLAMNMGAVNHVYLVGASEGALISTMLLEKTNTYNGVLALCGPLGGSPYETQYLGDFATIFNYFFPGVAATAAAAPTATPPSTPESVIAAAFKARPLQAAQLFSVTGAAFDLRRPETAVASALSILAYSSVPVRVDQALTAGGSIYSSPYGNLSTYYRGSLNDKLLNTKVTRVTPDSGVQSYVRQFYTPSGKITRPIVTLHNLLDPVVPFTNELMFARQVRNTGHAKLLTMLPARQSYGNCIFDPSEIINAFKVLALKAQ